MSENGTIDVLGEIQSAVARRLCSGSVLAEVLAERIAQHEEWGEQNHPMGTGIPDAYQYIQDVHATSSPTAGYDDDDGWCPGFAAGVALSSNEASRDHTWLHVLGEAFFCAISKSDPKELRVCLVWVAAVAVQMVECLDRGEG